MNEDSPEWVAANEWVFEINGHKWSNNDDTAADNFASFLAGYKAAMDLVNSEKDKNNVEQK